MTDHLCETFDSVTVVERIILVVLITLFPMIQWSREKNITYSKFINVRGA